MRTAAAQGATTADITLRLSQVEINVPLADAVFEVDVPRDAAPLTLEELRRAGPLGGVKTHLRVWSRARTRRSTSICACSASGPTAITSCARCFRPSSCTTRWSALERPGPFTLKCRTPGVPLDDSNLVWKAAAALWTALGRAGEPRDAVVTIDKTIPMEAGLGGGSADAAAALLALGAAVGRRAA